MYNSEAKRRGHLLNCTILFFGKLDRHSGILITSTGQLFTHVPHPVHNSRSIFSMAITVPPY